MSEAPEPDRIRVIQLLRMRAFRRFWLGQSVSALGNSLYGVAIVEYVLTTRHSVALLGFVLGARALGGGLASLLGGFLADRWPRIRVLGAADAVRGVAVITLALLPGTAPGDLLVAVTSLLGAGEAFFLPAYTAIIPALVGSRGARAANGANALSVNVGQTVGPAAAAGLIYLITPRGVLLVDAATFAVSLISLVSIRREAPAPPASRQQPLDLLGGVREVLSRPWLAASVLGVGAFTCVGLAPLLVLLPVVAKADYAHGTALYGAWLTAYGIGSIIGAWLAGRYDLKRPGLVAQLGLLPIAAALVTLGASADPPAVAAVLVLAGAGYSAFGVIWTTALHKEVPNQLLGRVSALDAALTLILLPLGYAGTGVLLKPIGAEALLLAAAASAGTLALLPLLAKGGARYATGNSTHPPSTS